MKIRVYQCSLHAIFVSLQSPIRAHKNLGKSGISYTLFDEMKRNEFYFDVVMFLNYNKQYNNNE